jgi:hypothetical protein
MDNILMISYHTRNFITKKYNTQNYTSFSLFSEAQESRGFYAGVGVNFDARE